MSWYANVYNTTSVSFDKMRTLFDWHCTALCTCGIKRQSVSSIEELEFRPDTYNTIFNSNTINSPITVRDVPTQNESKRCSCSWGSWLSFDTSRAQCSTMSVKESPHFVKWYRCCVVHISIPWHLWTTRNWRVMNTIWNRRQDETHPSKK